MVAFDPDGPAPTGSGIFGLPHKPEEARLVLLPVPWDVTTSYRAGAARGPEAILAASRQVDLYDALLGRIYEPGISLLPVPDRIAALNARTRPLAERVIEAGGDVGGDPALGAALDAVNRAGAELNEWVRGEACRWLDAGKVVGVVGGDHSTPFGAIEELARRNSGLGILHIDAHADLRDAYEGFAWSHASIMRNVVDRVSAVGRVVQVGLRDLGEAEHDYQRAHPDRVRAFFAEALAARQSAGVPWATLCHEIVEALPQRVYVSFDIDGLDPSLCPSTGTPVPGGLSFWQATELLACVGASGRSIVGFDLTEVAPGVDEWDANVGARMLYKLCGQALRGTASTQGA